jgi:S1-C subfamily serine protease
VISGVAAALIVLAFRGNGARAAGATATATPVLPPAVRTGGLTPERVYASASPGVVVITATERQTVPGTFFTPPFQRDVRSLGSGLVFDTSGDIATNAHVIAGASSVRVGFGAGSTYPARIVGVDRSTDLGVVRVQAPSSALHPLPLGDSSQVTVGEPVFALGNPFGLERTLTAGIVSATGRDIQAPNGKAIDGVIQTDAAINQGNSGGPLLDASGRVIGINAQIESAGGSGNVGIGFAIPSRTVNTIVPQLIANGSVRHAWLGVAVQSIDPGLAHALKGLPSHGVVVTAVDPGSPAAAAGLRAGAGQATIGGLTSPVGGDAVVTVDGRSVTSASELVDAVSNHRPGDRITLGVVRSGHERTVTVTLAEAPS